MYFLTKWLAECNQVFCKRTYPDKPNISLLEVEILLFGGGMSATIPLSKLCIPPLNTCISAKHSFEAIFRKNGAKVWDVSIHLEKSLRYRLFP